VNHAILGAWHKPSAFSSKSTMARDWPPSSVIVTGRRSMSCALGSFFCRRAGFPSLRWRAKPGPADHRSPKASSHQRTLVDGHAKGMTVCPPARAGVGLSIPRRKGTRPQRQRGWDGRRVDRPRGGAPSRTVHVRGVADGFDALCEGISRVILGTAHRL
jgi:hypothetical protein